MKAIYKALILLLACSGCAKHISLPANSTYNVMGTLNDSTWYGTGKVLRLRKSGETSKNVKRFNLVVFTDIDYPGMGDGPNPNTDNGCLDPECTRTQSLVIYNIPLKKQKHSIAKLDKDRKLENEYTTLSYIGNAGGLQKLYTHQGGKPGWIRINRIDKSSGTVEGSFQILFQEDNRYGYNKRLPKTTHLSDGLFRIKITDVLLR
jgi:hypothetical protein